MLDPRLSAVSRAGGVQPLPSAVPARRDAPASGPGSFAAALEGAGGLRFSAHAESRLASRGISLDSSQLARLGAGVDALARKGSREALVMLDDVALVVAVPNRTVVTAVPSGEGGAQSVFTNIDAAVIG